ncbi:MAG: hypothetical protein ACRETA_11620 [Gammaproteobacteria bacterium]
MNRAEMSEYLLITAAGSSMFPGPEGTAAFAAQVGLLGSGWLKSHGAVVLFDTGNLSLSIFWDDLASDWSSSFILFIYKLLLIPDTNNALTAIKSAGTSQASMEI